LKAAEIIKKYFFYSILSGFLSGLLFYHFIGTPLKLHLLLALLGAVLFAYCLRIKNIKSEVSASLFIFSVFLIFFSLGSWRYESLESRPISPLAIKAGGQVDLEGEIINFPEKRERSQRAIIESEGEKILIYARHYPTLHYGDTIRVSGNLVIPESFETDAGRIFDYPNYLKKSGIFYILQFAEAEIIEEGGGNILKKYLFLIKEKSIAGSEKILPSPASNLLSGILLGLPDSSGEYDEDFRKTGLSHITVLSGYNISVIALGALFVFSFLSYRKKFIVSGVFVILFTIMVASGAATWRAAIMALVIVMGKLLFRRISAWRSLYIAGFLMIFFNPLIIFYDPGFQLSFLATAGILGFSLPLSKKLTFLPKVAGIREAVAVSLSAQALVIPLIVYTSGQFSTVSILANMLGLPAVAPAMLAGFVAIVIASFPGFLYLPFAYIGFILLKYILIVAEILAALPMSLVNLPFENPIIPIMVYILIFSLMYAGYRKRSEERLKGFLGEDLNSIYREPYSQNPQKLSPN
jgi:competence protein ComEC